jgi:hypothetical protein
MFIQADKNLTNFLSFIDLYEVSSSFHGVAGMRVPINNNRDFLFVKK